MWKSSSRKQGITSSFKQETSSSSIDPVSDLWSKVRAALPLNEEKVAEISEYNDSRDVYDDTTINGNKSNDVESETGKSFTYGEDDGNNINAYLEQDDSGNIEIEASKQKKKYKPKSSLKAVTKMFGSLMSNASSNGSNEDKKTIEESNNFLNEEYQTSVFLKKASVEESQKAKAEGSKSGRSASGVEEIVTNNSNDSNEKTSTSPESTNIGWQLLQLVTGNKTGSDNEKKAITDIVAQVRLRMDVEQYGSDSMMEESTSMKEILGMFYEYKHQMGKLANKYVGNVDFRRVTPTAVMYYLEREDEIKNPSWKRRQHRFCPGINISEVQKLNVALDIAMLSYADTVDEIRSGLASNKDEESYELVHVQLRSSPGQPASFMAVKNDEKSLQKKKKSKLEVIIVVRGTKTAADAFTDLLCDSEPYQGGKAHSFIVTSGIYIADKYLKLLLDLLDHSGASKINLTLIGHSLGAGAASIAAMEFNNEKGLFYSPKINARAIGFGCPALVSEDLGKKSSAYITTVINDSDLVPRLSGISVANLFHDVLAFDWREYAKKDLQCTLQELEKSQPLLFRTGTCKAIQSIVETLLKKYGKDLIVDKKVEKLPVELFPPGKCLHFYNDGKGISANFVPNNFFNEIDVTRRMIDDHLFFSGYQGVFLAAARQHKRDHHFRFDIQTPEK